MRGDLCSWYALRMSKNAAAILYGICFLALGAVMAFMHWLITGIDQNFGIGVAVGLFLGYGFLTLGSKAVREAGMRDY